MEARHVHTNTAFSWVVTVLCSWAIVATCVQLNQQLAAERDENSQRLEHLASTDALTGVANRRTFEAMLKNTLDRNKRYKNRFALFYIDLDDFKSINDQYGHAVGDEVLILAAERLRSSMREMDVVARIGGDEFAVIADNIVSEDKADELQQKMQNFFQTAMNTTAGDILVEASCGYSLYPDAAECAQSLRIRADRAMYRSKEERKRSTVLVEPVIT